jgi:hypothetical protein
MLQSISSTDGWAVLLVGEEGRKPEVPRRSLPRGVKEGHWLQVEVEGDQLVSAVLDREETAKAKQRVREKLERLRKGEQLGHGPDQAAP